MATDIIEKLKALRGSLWAECVQAREPVTKRAWHNAMTEVVALLALVEPKTCATCRHWKRFRYELGESQSALGKCGQYVTGPGSLNSITKQSFGCNQWAPSPRPAPSRDTPETRA